MNNISLFKYTDKDGNNIDQKFIFDTHADYLDKYLSFYKQLPNLTEVIVCATDGIFKLTNNGIEYFIKHNHQQQFTDKKGNLRGVPDTALKQVRTKLIKSINDLSAASNFDEIMEIVTTNKASGFGELAIYDTSLRIASYFNIEPEKVYLHAGARAGFEILAEKGYIELQLVQRKIILKNQLPEEFETLTAMEVEHFACSKKDRMPYLSIKQPKLLK